MKQKCIGIKIKKILCHTKTSDTTSPMTRLDKKNSHNITSSCYSTVQQRVNYQNDITYKYDTIARSLEIQTSTLLRIRVPQRQTEYKINYYKEMKIIQTDKGSKSTRG